MDEHNDWRDRHYEVITDFLKMYEKLGLLSEESEKLEDDEEEEEY